MMDHPLSGLNWRGFSTMKPRADLDQAWRTASSMIGDRALVVDMTFVTGAEREGRSLLARWYAEGAQLIARSKASRALAEAIVGEPLPQVVSAGNARRGADMAAVSLILRKRPSCGSRYWRQRCCSRCTRTPRI